MTTQIIILIKNLLKKSYSCIQHKKKQIKQKMIVSFIKYKIIQKNIKKKIQKMSKDNTIKQCVLICQPLTSDYNSSVFVKLGLTSAIDMCVNWVVDHGIKEIFIFYSSTSKTHVEDFVHSAKPDVKMHLNFVKSQAMTCFGDVMRQIQFRNIISQDFLILYADTATNLDLTRAIQTHMKKKIELKSVVLTTVVRDNSNEGKIHITSSQSGEILQMEQDNNKKFTLNQERINLKKINVQFRRDLSHCDIYLCTVQVFKSFRENHQYRTMFQFIHGMLTSEVYEEKIIAHVLASHEQAFRLNKARDLYLAYISYISNQFYPYTLARSKRTHQKSDQLKFVAKNFNKIIFNDVNVPRESYISNTCYIGEQCCIGVNVEIEKSIITHSCQISNNVSLKNCIILQGCIIAEHSKFQNCLIQKVNDNQQIRRFKIFPKQHTDQIITEPLFEETPPPEESTFEQQLQQILEDEPRMEMLNELNAIRKHHNKSLHEFTKQMIRTINPKGAAGVQSLTEDWGQLISKIHDNQNLLMDSLYYACINIPQFQKGFHIFLQYFYHFEWLGDFKIIGWFEEAKKKHGETQTLKKCQKFIETLKQNNDDSQQQSNEQEQKQSCSEQQKNESKSENSSQQKNQ